MFSTLGPTGVPDGAVRLKLRSAGWNRAGWELNILEKVLQGRNQGF